MKIYWWQGGLHIEPQTDKEFAALAKVTEILEGEWLNGIKIYHSVPTGPVRGLESSNKKPVVRVNESA